MGVAGSGKSAVGAKLAERLGAKFFDADDFHPESNLLKMAGGIPLDDADRAPWLRRLRRDVIDATPEGQCRVLACSALKKRYRDILGVGSLGIRLIYLQGDAVLLAKRLAHRAGHFMKAGMLESQLAALEEPHSDEGITLKIDQGVEQILSEILLHVS